MEYTKEEINLFKVVDILNAGKERATSDNEFCRRSDYDGSFQTNIDSIYEEVKNLIIDFEITTYDYLTEEEDDDDLYEVYSIDYPSLQTKDKNKDRYCKQDFKKCFLNIFKNICLYCNYESCIHYSISLSKKNKVLGYHEVEFNSDFYKAILIAKEKYELSKIINVKEENKKIKGEYNGK